MKVIKVDGTEPHLVEIVYDTETKGKIRISKVYEFKWDDYVVGVMPKSCEDCMVGYRFANDDNPEKYVPNACGWKQVKDREGQGRPKTCKLKTIEDFLKSQNL